MRTADARQETVCIFRWQSLAIEHGETTQVRTIIVRARASGRQLRCQIYFFPNSSNGNATKNNTRRRRRRDALFSSAFHVIQDELKPR